MQVWALHGSPSQGSGIPKGAQEEPGSSHMPGQETPHSQTVLQARRVRSRVWAAWGDLGWEWATVLLTLGLRLLPGSGRSLPGWPGPCSRDGLARVGSGGRRAPRPQRPPHLRAGTEFEYTDSESEVKVRKRSPAGLLRPKKGLGEPGPALAAPSTRAPGPSSPDKAKLAAEKGRKARKSRGPKEPGLEAGPEASDDDLWTRRRSERIFLHDASAPPAPSSAAPAATKPGRCAKAGLPSPRKDTGRAKDRKDPRKVGPGRGPPDLRAQRGAQTRGVAGTPGDSVLLRRRYPPRPPWVVGTPLGAPRWASLMRAPSSRARSAWCAAVGSGGAPRPLWELARPPRQ